MCMDGGTCMLLLTGGDQKATHGYLSILLPWDPMDWTQDVQLAALLCPETSHQSCFVGRGIDLWCLEVWIFRLTYMEIIRNLKMLRFFFTLSVILTIVFSSSCLFTYVLSLWHVSIKLAPWCPFLPLFPICYLSWPLHCNDERFCHFLFAVEPCQ